MRYISPAQGVFRVWQRGFQKRARRNPTRLDVAVFRRGTGIL